MSTFPTALTTFTDPNGTDFEDVVDHAALHTNANDALRKLELYTGITGSSTKTTLTYKLAGIPANDQAVSLTGTEVLTNKTLTSPVLNTPIFSAAAIGAVDISTTAITLGYQSTTSDFTTTATTTTDVTGLSVAVTVPAGGRRLKITVDINALKNNNNAGNSIDVYLREGSTILHGHSYTNLGVNYAMPVSMIYSVVASAAAHTYKVSVASPTAGTTTLQAGSTYPSFILVELI